MKKILAVLAILLAFPFSAISQSKFDVNPAQYDFSGVFEADSPFSLGILGKEYKRLQIYYESVTKISSDTYKVKGSSNAAGNVCPFEGTMKIVSISKQNSEDFEADHPVYLLEASYSFKETGGIGTGVFTGKARFAIWFNGVTPRLEDGMLGADGYINSEYKGFWTSDKTKTKKIANWGSCRIPDSGDLDQGVGIFIPSPKYHSKGWLSYYNCNVFDNDEVIHANASYQEARKWWDKNEPVLVFSKTPKPVMKVYKSKGSQPGALIQTLNFEANDAPVYKDFNGDGFNDVVQKCDGGLLYVWSPKDGKFINVPSYSSIKYKDYLGYYPSLNKVVSSHYDRDLKTHLFYMYSYRHSEEATMKDTIVFEGSISEKDGLWKEYDQSGKLLKETNSPTKLSKVWSDYIHLTMAQ